MMSVGFEPTPFPTSEFPEEPEASALDHSAITPSLTTQSKLTYRIMLLHNRPRSSSCPTLAGVGSAPQSTLLSP